MGRTRCSQRTSAEMMGQASRALELWKVCMSGYIAFAAVATLIVVSPGPNLFLLLKNTPTFGCRVGLLNAVGFSCAIMCHAALSLIGLSAIVLTSSVVFGTIKFVGAGYLIYLGFIALRDAFRGVSHADPLEKLPKRADMGSRRAVAEGWLTNILNPKPSMFYLAAFPQFLNPAGSFVIDGLALGATHAAIALIWYGLIVAIIDRIRDQLGGEFGRRLKAASGVALVGIGFRFALERNPGA